MSTVRMRVITAVAERGIEAEPLGFPCDVSLGHGLEGRVDREALPFNARLRRDVGKPFELGNEFGSAVRVAGVIECVDADIEISRSSSFGETQRETEENCVARRYIGDWNTVAEAAFGNRNVAGQRRTTERSKVKRQNDLAIGETLRDTPRRIEFDPVALVVVHRERKHCKSLFTSDARTDHGVQSAGEKDDRFSHSLIPSFGAPQKNKA